MHTYTFSNNGPFSNIIESEKKHRYFKLHIQSWAYIHCIISMITSFIGIGIGVIFLLKTEWHEKFFIYRLTLAYLRRSDPIKYWLFYRIFFAAWIFIHFIHLATIFVTIVAVQKTSTAYLKPQLFWLIFQAGLFFFGLVGLVVISITGSKFTWDTIGILVFHLIFIGSNLMLLTIYHRFLDDKITALNELLMGQAKTVHFKENSSNY